MQTLILSGDFFIIPLIATRPWPVITLNPDVIRPLNNLMIFRRANHHLVDRALDSPRADSLSKTQTQNRGIQIYAFH